MVQMWEFEWRVVGVVRRCCINMSVLGSVSSELELCQI